MAILHSYDNNRQQAEELRKGLDKYQGLLNLDTQDSLLAERNKALKIQYKAAEKFALEILKQLADREITDITEEDFNKILGLLQLDNDKVINTLIRVFNNDDFLKYLFAKYVNVQAQADQVMDMPVIIKLLENNEKFGYELFNKTPLLKKYKVEAIRELDALAERNAGIAKAIVAVAPKKKLVHYLENVEKVAQAYVSEFDKPIKIVEGYIRARKRIPTKVVEILNKQNKEALNVFKHANPIVLFFAKFIGFVRQKLEAEQVKINQALAVGLKAQSELREEEFQYSIPGSPVELPISSSQASSFNSLKAEIDKAVETIEVKADQEARYSAPSSPVSLPTEASDQEQPEELSNNISAQTKPSTASVGQQYGSFLASPSSFNSLQNKINETVASLNQASLAEDRLSVLQSPTVLPIEKQTEEALSIPGSPINLPITPFQLQSPIDLPVPPSRTVIGPKIEEPSPVSTPVRIQSANQPFFQSPMALPVSPTQNGPIVEEPTPNSTPVRMQNANESFLQSPMNLPVLPTQNGPKVEESTPASTPARIQSVNESFLQQSPMDLPVPLTQNGPRVEELTPVSTPARMQSVNESFLQQSPMDLPVLSTQTVTASMVEESRSNLTPEKQQDITELLFESPVSLPLAHSEKSASDHDGAIKLPADQLLVELSPSSLPVVIEAKDDDQEETFSIRSRTPSPTGRQAPSSPSKFFAGQTSPRQGLTIEPSAIDSANEPPTNQLIC